MHPYIAYALLAVMILAIGTLLFRQFRKPAAATKRPFRHNFEIVERSDKK